MNAWKPVLISLTLVACAVSGYVLYQDARSRTSSLTRAPAGLVETSSENALRSYVQCLFLASCRAEFSQSARANRPFPLAAGLVFISSSFGVLALVIRRRIRSVYEGSLARRKDLSRLRTRDYLANRQAGTGILIGQHIEVPTEGPERRATLTGERLGHADDHMLVYKPGYGKRSELPPVAVFGTPRSGKTMHLVAQAVRWVDSFVALDVKGEIYRLTAGVALRRSKKRGRVFVLSPDGVGHQYNALAELMTIKNGVATAANIIAAVEQETGNGRFFAQRAATGLVAAFHAARVLNVPPLDLLYELVLEGGMGAFVSRLSALDHPKVRFELNLFLDPHGGDDFDLARALDDRSLTSAWGTMTKALGPFLSDEVRWLFRRSDFRASDLLKEKTYVYLQFPETTLEATARVYDLIVTSLTRGMFDYMAGRNLKKPDVRVMLLLDELYAAPVSNLPKICATATGRHITPVLYLQAPSMLEELYGPAGRKALLEACQIKLFYKSETPETARYISEIAWKTSRTDERRMKRRHFFGFAPNALSEGSQSREVISPDEVDLVGGEDREVILAKVSGKPLALVKRVDTHDGSPIGQIIAKYPPPPIPDRRHEITLSTGVEVPPPKPPKEVTAKKAAAAEVRERSVRRWLENQGGRDATTNESARKKRPALPKRTRTGDGESLRPRPNGDVVHAPAHPSETDHAATTSVILFQPKGKPGIGEETAASDERTRS